MFNNRKERTLNDCSSYKKVESAYNNALEKFTSGDMNAAKSAAEKAFELNHMIVCELLGGADWHVCDETTRRLQRESKFYKERFGKLWKYAPGALDWLSQRMEDHSLRMAEEFQRKVDLICADLPPDPELRFQRLIKVFLQTSIK